MEKYILCDSAPALYKATKFQDFISQNLDKKEKALNTLDFIEKNLGVELYNNDDNDDYSDYYRISRYENKKIYEIPKICFISDEKNGDDIEEEKVKKTSYVWNVKVISWVIVWFFIIFILSSITFANINNKIEKIENEKIENIKNEIVENINSISSELIKQEKLRREIEKSIEKVKKLEEENKNKRDEMISLAQ